MSLKSLLFRLFRRLSGETPASTNEKLIRAGLLYIGRHTYGSPRVEVFRGSEARVEIGSFCSISRGATFLTGGIHPTKWVSTFPFRIRFHLPGAFEDGMPLTYGNIIVGSDVWIGTEALILSGVHIGHGAILAARAVVTRDVEPYTIVGGVPAKKIGQRFNDRQIDSLLSIKWWDWPEEKITEKVELLSSENVDEFISRFEGKQRYKTAADVGEGINNGT